jgi:hypothetical protein
LKTIHTSGWWRCNVRKSFRKENVMLAMTEESLETELVYWIRDLIKELWQANTHLRKGCDCARGSFVAACRSQTVRWDCDKLNRPLKSAEEFSLLGLTWFNERSKT